MSLNCSLLGEKISRYKKLFTSAILLLLLLAVILTVFFLKERQELRQRAAPATGFVTACGRSLCLDGQQWYLYGASTYGQLDNPINAINLAKSGKLNTIRLVNYLNEGTGVNTNTAPYTEASWVKVDKFINEASKADIKIILDLSTYRNMLYKNNVNPYTQDWSQFITFVANRQNTASGILYKDDPTIALISFAGEVEPPNGGDNHGVTQQQVTDFFKRTGAQWKTVDPNHLVNSGGFLHLDWNSGIDWQAIFADSNNNVCSIHNYSNADNNTTPEVANYCAGINKPWITEEFGWEQTIPDTQRALNYQSMYALQKQYASAGVAFWNLGMEVKANTYDVNPNTPLTWQKVQQNAPDITTPLIKHDQPSSSQPALAASPIKTVFVILMENHDWSSVKGAAAPYITNTLLPLGAHAENYHNVPSGSLHPSEPNYIWLEAGSNVLPGRTFTDDSNPSASISTNTPDHLVSYIIKAGLSWKAYQEDISGSNCPLSSVNDYAPKHLPMIYFQDVVGNPPSTTNQNCITHVRPYTELATDLTNNTVPNYNFITPNLCNDMHDCSVSTGDTWLSQEIPKIMNSAAYKSGGAIFITWDEGGSGNNPIGMIVLSPFAKVNYSNTTAYSHSSFVRTVQEIFGLQPYLRDAAAATGLDDFFTVPLQNSSPTTPVTITAAPTAITTVVPTFFCIGCPTLTPPSTPILTQPISPTIVPTTTASPSLAITPSLTITGTLPVPTLPGSTEPPAQNQRGLLYFLLMLLFALLHFFLNLFH